MRSASLHVEQGEIVAIIGANGAGKTTLLNAIIGMLPASGRFAFADQNIAALEIEDRVALGLTLVPERRELFGAMPVEDNLLLGAFRLGHKAARREHRARLHAVSAPEGAAAAACRDAIGRRAADARDRARADGRAETVDAG